MSEKTYSINEIFASLQGEGARAGTANVFIRFSGCNLKCSVDHEEENGRFNCDTEFASGRRVTADEIISEVGRIGGRINWVILTGGEPALQIDEAMLAELHDAGYQIAIETNGTIALPKGIDWICVSPKTAEHTLKVFDADEVKYVRNHGQGIPKSQVRASHHFISPAWDANGLNRENLAWCIQLVKENPTWRLSVQQHKFFGIR